MGFYESIANYYDDIFIPNKKQIDFISKTMGYPPKNILDLACGTGSLSLKLAKLGYNVTGIDLDEQMIEKANNKNKLYNQNVKFLVDNILTFSFSKKFNGIYCIGNSIVHLDSLVEINNFFKNVKLNLKEEGKIIVQI